MAGEPPLRHSHGPSAGGSELDLHVHARVCFSPAAAFSIAMWAEVRQPAMSTRTAMRMRMRLWRWLCVAPLPLPSCSSRFPADMTGRVAAVRRPPVPVVVAGTGAAGGWARGAVVCWPVF